MLARSFGGEVLERCSGRSSENKDGDCWLSVWRLGVIERCSASGNKDKECWLEF